MRGTLQLVSVLALLSACSDDPVIDPDADGGDDGPFEVRYSTKYVDVAPGFSQQVCRGTLDELDRHVEMVATTLDIEVESRPTWYWHNPGADGAVSYDPPCGACTTDGGKTIESDPSSIFHELVHAVVVPAWGHSDIVFEEGIAIALDREAELLYYAEPVSELAGGTGQGGAHFSLWLLEQFGPAKYRELFPPRLTTASTKEQVFQAVEEVYGTPLPDLEAEFYATAPDIYPGYGRCDGLVHVPWQGNHWEFNTTVDCDAPHVFGPMQASNHMAVSVTLDIPELVDGTLLTAATTPNGFVELQLCLEEPLYDVVDPLEHVAFRGAGLSRALYGLPPAGRYRATFVVEADEPGDVQLRICEWNGEFPVSGEEYTFDPCVPDSDAP